MDVFYYELLFNLFVLFVEILIAAAVYCFINLIWITLEVLHERRLKKKIADRELQERKEIYRRRSAEFRKGSTICYRQE